MKSGAWLYSSHDIRGLPRCRHFAGSNEQFSAVDFVVVFEQPTFWRAGRTRAILVIGSSMARAHEQIRLREPTDWTSEVCTIDCEYLETRPIHVANPASDIGSIPIPGIHYGISIRRQARFSGRKLIEIAERNPGVIAVLSPATDRREKVTHDRHCKNHGDNAVKENSQLHEKRAPTDARW